jgi:cytochrome c oxidase cbb3-type subunit 3
LSLHKLTYAKDFIMSTNDPHHEEHADGIVEDREKAPPVYFSILFYGLIIWGIAFMSYYLLSGWSSDAEFQEKMAAHKGEPMQQAAAQPAAKPEPQPAVQAAAATEASAEELYGKYCASCHGADGKGGFGPDLSGEYVYGKNEIAVQESIASGRPNSMPAFDKRLSGAEIDKLTEYLLSL